MPDAPAPAAAMIGLPGPLLDDEQKARLRLMAPIGVALFARNIVEPEQVKRLTSDIRDALGSTAVIAVDQEGGRVARFGPPHWPSYPPAATIGAVYRRDRAAGLKAGFLLGRLIGEDLRLCGVTMNFAPVADLFHAAAHDVIGDRAFSDDPDVAAELVRAVMEGVLAAGVVPVVKHAPGHGRARADSHEEPPTIGAEATELELSDFIPFFAVGDAPAMMTAHIRYTAYDRDSVATCSPRVLTQVVRNGFGFQGLLLSDDLAMGALQGRPGRRAQDARSAGCDIALWCEPDFFAAEEVCKASGAMSGGSEVRWRSAFSRPVSNPADIDCEAARAELDAFLEMVA